MHCALEPLALLAGTAAAASNGYDDTWVGCAIDYVGVRRYRRAIHPAQGVKVAPSAQAEVPAWELAHGPAADYSREDRLMYMPSDRSAAETWALKELEAEGTAARTWAARWQHASPRHPEDEEAQRDREACVGMLMRFSQTDGCPRRGQKRRTRSSQVNS